MAMQTSAVGRGPRAHTPAPVRKGTSKPEGKKFRKAYRRKAATTPAPTVADIRRPLTEDEVQEAERIRAKLAIRKERTVRLVTYALERFVERAQTDPDPEMAQKAATMVRGGIEYGRKLLGELAVVDRRLARETVPMGGATPSERTSSTGNDGPRGRERRDHSGTARRSSKSSSGDDPGESDRPAARPDDRPGLSTTARSGSSEYKQSSTWRVASDDHIARWSEDWTWRSCGSVDDLRGVSKPRPVVQKLTGDEAPLWCRRVLHPASAEYAAILADERAAPGAGVHFRSVRRRDVELVDHTNAGWFHGPGLAQWLRDYRGEYKLLAADKIAERTICRWRGGTHARFSVVDRMLTKVGIHVSEVPAVLMSIKRPVDGIPPGDMLRPKRLPVTRGDSGPRRARRSGASSKNIDGELKARRPARRYPVTVRFPGLSGCPRCGSDLGARCECAQCSNAFSPRGAQRLEVAA